MRAPTAASKVIRSLRVRRDLYLEGGIPLLAHLTTTTIAPTIQNSARQSATATGTPNTTSVRTSAIPLLLQSLATGTNVAPPSISAANAQQLPNTNKGK